MYVTHDQEEALAVSDRLAVMRDGGLEQTGSPQEIYRQPATRFVAEFVGDNNVFSGEVVEQDGRHAVVRTDPHRHRIGIREPGVDLRAGDRVVFCVRPEAFVWDHGENRLTAGVKSSEFLGDRTRLYLDWDGQELLARTRKRLAGEVTLGFDPADAHLVSRES